MSVPARLLGIIDLARDLVERRPAPAAGPFRVELAGEALTGPLPAGAADALTRAAFLAPRGPDAAAPAVVGRCLDLAEEHDLWLDLEAPAGARFDDGLRRRMRDRVARLRLVAGSPAELDDADLLARATELAAALLGRVTLAARAAAPDVAALPPFLAHLGAAAPSPDVSVSPRDDAALAALRAAWPSLALRADAAKVNLRVAGAGLAAAGRPLDALAGWNILGESLRALFRPRPALCPFPWLMLRFESGGTVRPCPHPSGPVLPQNDGGWNGAALQALRGGFLGGAAPSACRGCTLLPRVLRSLAGSRPAPRAGPPAARAIEV